MNEEFTLLKEVRKNGFLYVQIVRSENVAIYQQRDPKNDLKHVAYEVFRIKIQRERYFKGRHFPRKEVLAANEDFGKTAWTFRKGQKALIKFINLILNNYYENFNFKRKA